MILTKYRIFLVISISIAVAGLIWLKRQMTDHQPKPQPFHATNTVITTKPVSLRSPIVTRSLYGQSSLSKEERKILYQPFMNCRKIGCGDTNIYRVGMICLKHRLTRSEVMEALSESPVKPIHNGYLDYQTSIGHLLTFKFDASGNLLLVRTHERFEFPSLESVLPDTPIDPPMIPKVEKRLDLEN